VALAGRPPDVAGHEAVTSQLLPGVEPSSATGQKLTAFAICSIQPAGYVITTQTNTNHVAPVVLTGGAQCPAGTAIVGGGIPIQNPRPAVTLGSSIDDSGPQWFSEVAITDQVPATVTISAICAA
jgi:hypothetical protein